MPLLLGWGYCRIKIQEVTCILRINVWHICIGPCEHILILDEAPYRWFLLRGLNHSTDVHYFLGSLLRKTSSWFVSPPCRLESRLQPLYFPAILALCINLSFHPSAWVLWWLRALTFCVLQRAFKILFRHHKMDSSHFLACHRFPFTSTCLVERSTLKPDKKLTKQLAEDAIIFVQGSHCMVIVHRSHKIG